MLPESPDITVDATPPGDNTTLWHGAKKVNGDTMRALLSKGTIVDSKAFRGTTAL